jgi:hypothetical protein
MRILELFWRDQRGGMVTGIAKSAIAIGFISVLAANFISSRTDGLDSARLAEVAAVVSRNPSADPMTTGSLRRAADATRLDPCVAPR